MKKRNLSPEQIAARDARRAKFRELSKRIAAMSPEQRATLCARMPAIVTVEGRALSPFNSCLVVSQRESVTIVGGFRQWIAHGRSVRKGEHGMQIWIPCGGGKIVPGPDASGEAEPAADGEGTDRRFIVGTVFDVTQTQEIAAGEPGEAIDTEARGEGAAFQLTA